MKLWILGSGSKGNALLVECDGQRVLVDAGFPSRTLAARLGAIGVAPESIEAAVITHEHGDHACGAARSAAEWGWKLHATAGTLACCPSLRKAGARSFATGATIDLGRIRVETTETSHDAAESVALVVTCRRTGARLGIAYDLGAATPPLARALRDLDLLVLESNHDDDMLRFGPYPRVVQNRIAGRRGHLSNGDAARLAQSCAHGGLRQLVLAHVSEQCNTPGTAHRAVSEAVRATRFRGRIDVAGQRTISGPYHVGARKSAAVQLELGLSVAGRTVR
ncbi:MAG TPA: MBL fold metallo-hydrolase [Gemmatimonadaceae bacterium]|nr:MBL fold metallo-hydrolase [Gemmatimonadaceae bacterium]